MSRNVLVIPATVKVGPDFPTYLPLPDGNVKPTIECSKDEVRQAVAECRVLAQQSRARLEEAYQEHLKDIELLAQVSAYLQKFDQWADLRTGGQVNELLWQVETGN